MSTTSREYNESDFYAIMIAMEQQQSLLINKEQIFNREYT